MRTFFFYDLETTGFSAKHDRIMQFAGIRTDKDLNELDQEENILIKLTDDTLPSPGAILTTHITPQKTLADGINETEFCAYFLDKVATPDTVILGYNSVRFDDEFLRYTLWHNFRDPYEWAWAEGRSRWDLLDVTRMVRALRPDGVNWPTKRAKDGKTGEWVERPTVNLVDMAKSNGFENKQAHDALADVRALINLARLLRDKQPRMWNYLYKHRSKEKVAEVVRLGRPFVYTSGRYTSENAKTTIAVPITRLKNSNNLLVWDLRYAPTDFVGWSEQTIMANLTANYEQRHTDGFRALPIKEISLNKCPAVAPVGTLDDGSEERIHLTKAEAQTNLKLLQQNKDFLVCLINTYNARPEWLGDKDVEGQLYDSFTPEADRPKCRAIAAMTDARQLADFHPEFNDDRLPELLLRYKARMYPKSLSEDEQKRWEKYRSDKLQRELPKYMEELQKAAAAGADDYILQELQLWAESIMPYND